MCEKHFKVLCGHFEKRVKSQLNYRPSFSLDFQRCVDIFCDLFITYSETYWVECNDVLKVTENKTLRAQHREKLSHSYHINFKEIF
jgi:hypothetical protein